MCFIPKYIFFCQSKVNQKQVIAVLATPHAKIAWLQVSVNHILAVDVFQY
jgi:hypothetical protein